VKQKVQKRKKKLKTTGYFHFPVIENEIYDLIFIPVFVNV
jgi:hypothetical protein